MPSTTIEVRTQHPQDREERLIAAVQAALVEGFKIPPDDKCVRLIAHAPHRFLCASKRSQPDLYTLVTVTAFSGRSLDAKRALYQAIVRRLSDEGIPTDCITITLIEVPFDNWGLGGGQVASEMDLGFKVDV